MVRPESATVSVARRLRRIYDRRMRSRSTSRSVLALGLVALLCALSTGLPSHHHAHGASGGEAGSVVEAGDHHAHGVELVEQLDRVPQTPPHVAASPISGFEPVAGTERLTDPTPEPRAAPTGRSPPSVAPRAPPLSA